MSGIRTTLAGLTYRADHVAAAEAKAQTVASLHNQIQIRSMELIRDLNLLLASMQSGDPNISTLNAQIAALS